MGEGISRREAPIPGLGKSEWSRGEGKGLCKPRTGDRTGPMEGGEQGRKPPAASPVGRGRQATPPASWPRGDGIRPPVPWGLSVLKVALREADMVMDRPQGRRLLHPGHAFQPLKASRPLGERPGSSAWTLPQLSLWAPEGLAVPELSAQTSSHAASAGNTLLPRRLGPFTSRTHSGLSQGVRTSRKPP